MSERLDWPHVWMKMARTIAKRSLCERDRVGAVIVTETNRIVAVGYNNPAGGFDHQGRNCIHWCPRMKADRKLIGYEGDSTTMMSAPKRITEQGMGAYPGDNWVEVNGLRYYTDDMPEEQLTELMESCGYLPMYEYERRLDGNPDRPCISLHAEANAIAVCDRDQRESGTIYTTSTPCLECAKLIANSGIGAVVYRETKRGLERQAREQVDPLKLMRDSGIVVMKYEGTRAQD